MAEPLTDEQLAAWPKYPFPEKDLYLLKCDGHWPVYTMTSVTHVINQAKTLAEKNKGYRVRIWRVTAIQVEELAVQREIVREALVPAGTEEGQ